MTFGYDAAIFDMDGTLLDSMRYWRYTSLEYLLKHHLPIQPDILTRMIDTPVANCLARSCRGLACPIISRKPWQNWKDIWIAIIKPTFR